MIEQKSFGAFITERYGPNWVYAHRRLPRRFARNGEEQTVILPKQQRELKRDYKREWGREYDPEFWQMLCALQGAEATLALCSGKLPDYAEERRKETVAMVRDAIKAATS